MVISIMSLAFGQISAAGPPDFDIVTMENLSLTVAGTAGATLPAYSGDIYVYAFVTSETPAIAGDTVVYLAASHDFLDDPEQSGEGDLTWHAHKAVLDSNFCISSMDNTPTASLSGSTVDITDAELTGTLTMAFTGVFTETSLGTCPIHVFDM